MKILLILLLSSVTALSQDISYFNQGFLRQPSAAADRTYLGIGTNSGGSGSVTNFAITGLSPLFTASVTTPTTYPTVSYSAVSQSPNLFYAGPSSGGAVVPSFRAMVTGDLPDISALVRADVSATAPVLYNSGTGVFSMHVADTSDDGYLSSSDWNTFNSKGSGTLVSVTNAAPSLGVSIISTSNSPTPSFKSLVSGTGATVTDQGGTAVVFSATSSGGIASITNAAPSLGVSAISTSNSPIPSLKSFSGSGSVSVTDNGGTNIIIGSTPSGNAGVDLSMTNLASYVVGGANYAVDFNWPAQTLLTTNTIEFDYSTNWGLSATSRVSNIRIPPSNLFRKMLFKNAATNWHAAPNNIIAIPIGYSATLKFQSFGGGETNIWFTPWIDVSLASSNVTAAFTPTNIGGCVFWLDASVGAYQDVLLTVPAVDGSEVRGWKDLSGTFVVGATNDGALAANTFYRGPNTSPGNIPSVNFVSYAGAALWTGAMRTIQLGAAYTYPNWAFMMVYGRGGPNFLDGVGSSSRFSCAPSQGGTPMNLFYGNSINASSPKTLAWTLFEFEQNTTGVIKTNSVQAVSGSAGSQQPAGFTIGGDYNGDPFTANEYLAEVVVYHTNLTAGQVLQVETYFRMKYGAW